MKMGLSSQESCPLVRRTNYIRSCFTQVAQMRNTLALTCFKFVYIHILHTFGRNQFPEHCHKQSARRDGCQSGRAILSLIIEIRIWDRLARSRNIASSRSDRSAINDIAQSVNLGRSISRCRNANVNHKEIGHRYFARIRVSPRDGR